MPIPKRKAVKTCEYCAYLRMYYPGLSVEAVRANCSVCQGVPVWPEWDRQRKTETTKPEEIPEHVRAQFSDRYKEENFPVYHCDVCASKSEPGQSRLLHVVFKPGEPKQIDREIPVCRSCDTELKFGRLLDDLRRENYAKRVAARPALVPKRAEKANTAEAPPAPPPARKAPTAINIGKVATPITLFGVKLNNGKK